MPTTTRQQAQHRLTEIQARLYQIGQEEKKLTDEARTIAGFLNLADREDKEKAQEEEARRAEEEAGPASE